VATPAGFEPATFSLEGCHSALTRLEFSRTCRFYVAGCHPPRRRNSIARSINCQRSAPALGVAAANSFSWSALSLLFSMSFWASPSTTCQMSSREINLPVLARRPLDRPAGATARRVEAAAGLSDRCRRKGSSICRSSDCTPSPSCRIASCRHHT
jgi:hypothetical protein